MLGSGPASASNRATSAGKRRNPPIGNPFEVLRRTFCGFYQQSFGG